MLLRTAMGEQDDKLWCGIENNYDLFALVDLSTVEGAPSRSMASLSIRAGSRNTRSGRPSCVPDRKKGMQPRRSI